MEQEEAFNLAIRRMLRSSNTYYVIHVAYSGFSFIRNNQDLLQLLQNTTQDTVQPYGGAIYQMRKGDQFVVFAETAGPKVPAMADNITAAAFPDRKPGDDDDKVLARVFHIPHDYMELRRAASVYLDASGAAAIPPPAVIAPDAKPLKDDLDGTLTAWALSRIENALAEFDLTAYLRSQCAYELDAQGRWLPLFEEHYTSVADLHRDKFPKLALQPDERMFLELCRAFDRRSVPEIIRRHRGKPGNRVSLNLALATISSSFFTKYVREAPDIERQTLVLEINRSDLLQQPRETVKALKAMREGGFGVALDGVTLDLLSLTNLHRVEVDFIKIALTPATMWLLRDGDCLAALKKLPRDKIILCRCEKESALPVGKAFGLTKFQGWLIDRLAAGKSESESAAPP
ncbi:MAG: EAL domain-containing protein [Rhodospirillaceae bacterium]